MRSEMRGATPPNCAWPKESFNPVAERNSPSGPYHPLRYGDDALVITRQRLLDLGQEMLLIECHLRQQQNMRRIALTFGSERGGGCRPARVPPHQFHREH